MRVTLQLPDDIAQAYEQYGLDTRMGLEAAIVERLKTFAGLHPQTRFLMLTGEPLAKLEDQFGLALQEAGQLVSRVQRLAALEIGEHRIEFTVGQWEEMQHRAKKRGITVADEIRQIWAKLKEDFFTYV